MIISHSLLDKVFNAIKMTLYIQKLVKKRKESANKVMEPGRNGIEEYVNYLYIFRVLYEEKVRITKNISL